MIDEDDQVAIALDYALRDLLRAAHEHADPDVVLRDWLEAVFAVLVTQQWGGRTLESLLLICARRVVLDSRALL